MIVFVLLFVVASTFAGPLIDDQSDRISRISGGQDAPEGAYPYQVSFRNAGKRWCGGSIINANWILTAAHCFIDIQLSELSVVVGSILLSEGGDHYKAQKLILHESFGSNPNFEGDIALVQVDRPIQFNDKVKPIALETDDVGAGVPAVATGWGDLFWQGPHLNELQSINLLTVSVEQCREAHKNFLPVFETNICTLTKAGEGVCHGDSGGPLVANGKVIGVVSWGQPCALGVPDVFVRVSSYIDWINSKMQS